jgi:protease I
MNYVMKFRTPALLALLIIFAAGCEGRQAEEMIPEPGLLHGKNVAFLITEGFHDGETMFPMGYLINHGANITVIGVARGEYTAYNSDVTAIVTRTVSEVSPANFDALVIPGGHSPANLREHEDVISFVRSFVETDKPTAAICHGPQVLVTAGVIEGRTLTGVGGIKDEITGAGATFEDVEVMVDGNIITSRTPPDLPAFSRQIAQSLRN